MFSLKTIQKKIEKLSKAPPPKGNTSGKRKRKNSKAEPKSSTVKKQRKGAMIPLSAPTTTTTTTTTTKTDMNKNKLPRPHTRTAQNRKRNAKKKCKANRSMSEGDTDPDEQKTSLGTSTSLPVLYVDSTNRQWGDGHDSESYVAVSDGEGDARGSNSDANLSWSEGRGEKFKGTLPRSKAMLVQPGDGEDPCSSDQKQDRTFDLYPKEATELSSGSESSNKGQKKQDRYFSLELEKMELTSDLETSDKREEKEHGSYKYDHKEVSSVSETSKKGKRQHRTSNLNPQGVITLTSDSDQPQKGKKRHQHKAKTKAMQLSSDSETSHNRIRKRDKASSFDHNEITELTSDSDQPRRERKQHKQRTRDAYRRETDLYTDRHIIGESIATTTTESGAVVAALPEGATLYVQGIVGVRPLLGTAEILGYILRQGQSQHVHSLPTCSLLGVTAVEAQTIDVSVESLCGVDGAWVTELKEKTTSAVLLEFTRHPSPRIDFLLNAGWGVLGDIRERQTHWQSIKASVVTRENCHKYRVTHILPEWKEVVETIVETLKCGSVPCVVVGGGKGVGKSTFFKYLANSLLSTTPDKGVMCLDFDPGQPELSLSTALSLTHLTEPLLAPAYAHELKRVSLSCTHKLIGTVSPQFVTEAYGTAVRELCEAVKERRGEVPVLVNTMGWTQGTGVGLMLDVLRQANPTHVIQIQGRKAKLNYPFLLEAATVSAAWGGITTQAGSTSLHYSLVVLPSGGQSSSAPHISQPQALRELRVLAEAGHAVEYGCRVKVPWSRVALHVCEEQVPRDRILQVINAQLVALCSVDPACVSTPSPDLPQLLMPGSGFGDLLGWGVVMGVDPLTSELHLAASLPAQVVNEQVNAIVLPRIHLPASFYKVFYIGGKGPYLEKESREGAGRLRVGRRVKPRK